MFEFVQNLFPPATADEAQTYAWRRSIAITVIATGALTLVNTWVMWGFFPVSLVFSGFATASDMKVIQAEQRTQNERMQQDKNELKVAILAGNIALVYDRMCNALRAIPRRQEEADAWQAQLNDLLTQYVRANNGQPYPIRSCT